MPLWTDEQDRQLLALETANPEATSENLAILYTQITGTASSGDAVRNRLRRIKEAMGQREAEQVRPPEEHLFDIPAAPKDTYIGFDMTYWDLETTGLTAIMGRLLACAFADPFGQTKAFRYEDYPGKTPIDDSALAVAIRDELEKANIWVTWNGRLFDVPFLNARLLKAGQRPLRNDIPQIDLMYFARGQFVRIGSSKLDNVSKFINSPNRKTALDWDTWALAGVGDRAAMDKVVEHALADVLVTRDCFAVLRPHVRKMHR